MTNEHSDLPILVGSQDVGALLGISRTRVNQLVDQGVMPTPAGYISKHRSRIWYTQDIIDWAKARDRTIRFDALDAK